MLKKIPLRIRFTLVASMFLMISCVTLMVLSNLSAIHMIDAMPIVPAESDVSAPMMELEPVYFEAEPFYHIFQQKTAIATIFIVTLGSVATYFAAGYVLKPIRNFSDEVRKRTIEALDTPIILPQSADEIQNLTVAFNQMMAELQRSFLIQREFSANAAHELRTPLTIMRAKLDVFLLSENLSLETREMAGSLEQQLENLSKLVEDLLWFSQDFSSEKLENVPLYPLFCDVADELSSISNQKEIKVHIQSTDCCVWGQDRLLERVFYNLLENALKYSPSHTQVQIIAKKEGKYVQVQVIDQGEGIPECYLDTIFEPFFRVNRSRSRSIGGSGLGLAVCKRILERYQARIDVFPNKPSGCIFQILFPA